MRWPSLATVVAALLPSTAFALTPALAPGESAVVTTLKTFVPDESSFVVHGTFPVPLAPFDRFDCPYQVVDPDGLALRTQWELVARLQDTMIIEVRALVEDNDWSGEQIFEVVPGSTAFDLTGFDLETLGLAIAPAAIEFIVEDQNFQSHVQSISGWDSTRPFHRFGPTTVTIERAFVGEYGSLQSWMTVDAGSQEIELILNWNNGTLPANPDVFFRSLKLDVRPGWTWTPLLPDPAVGNGYLCMPDQHVLLQRAERSFRLIIHKLGATPDLTYRGWGVGDWSQGGYTAQSVALPTLDHTSVDLSINKDIEFDLLATNQATVPGVAPVSFLWPAYGVKYGGMTGGIHIDQVPAVPTAVTGQPDGILTLYLEQLRYGARQRGCIYEPDGRPIELDDYVNPGGGVPWSMFNATFLGNPPDDEPFFFTQTGPGDGVAAYDPSVFDPIDSQHLVRRTRSNKALVWLDNDPLAALYTRMDAELARMTYHEGPGGRLALPVEANVGVGMGRAESWAADVMLTAYAISGDAWRTRSSAWFQRFVLALYSGQMSNKLFSAISHGKVANDPPYGHLKSQVCPYGIHAFEPGNDNAVADFWVHRGNEQVFLVHALRGIQQTVGIPCGQMIESGGEGIWDFGWKPGTNGVLDRYPAGPLNGPRYTSIAQIPPGLTDPVPRDSYHPGNALAYALMEGGAVAPGFLALTDSPSAVTALVEIQSWGTVGIGNFAQALTILQYAVP